jgi:hypothetical protein
MDCICSSDDGQIALEKESKAGKKSLAGSLAEQKYGIRQDLSDSISAGFAGLPCPKSLRGLQKHCKIASASCLHHLHSYAENKIINNQELEQL